MAMLVEKCKGYKIRITSLLLGNIFLKSFEQSRYRFLEAKNATLCQPKALAHATVFRDKELGKFK
jgi:hypothetical protein